LCGECEHRGPQDWRVVTADAELADSGSLEVVVCVELAWVETDEEAVLVPDVLALDVFVLDVAGNEVFVAFVRTFVEVLVAALVVPGELTPCEPPAAIAAQASANVERLAAATWRRVRATRLARARRSCSPRVVDCSPRVVDWDCSPRVVEAALVFDMGAT
jgi:hypothetical protein